VRQDLRNDRRLLDAGNDFELPAAGFSRSPRKIAEAVTISV